MPEYASGRAPSNGAGRHAIHPGATLIYLAIQFPITFCHARLRLHSIPCHPPPQSTIRWLAAHHVAPTCIAIIDVAEAQLASDVSPPRSLTPSQRRSSSGMTAMAGLPRGTNRRTQHLLLHGEAHRGHQARRHPFDERTETCWIDIG